MNRQIRLVSGPMVAVGMLFLARTTLAASGTWTSMGNGTTEYWTNNANWTGASYPGTGAGETALFTNGNAGGSYTAILDTTLPNALSTIMLGTNGSKGAVNLILTNAITLQSGATTVGANATNNTLSVLPAVNWNMSAAALTVGSGTATGNVLTVNNATVTNISTLTIGAGNTLSLSNGAYLSMNGALTANGTVKFGGPGAASVMTNTASTVITIGSGGTMTISNATYAVNAAVGNDVSIGSGNGTLQVLSNGVLSFTGAPRNLDVGKNASSNSFLINGGTVNAPAAGGGASGYTLAIGNGATAFSNSISVVNGGVFIFDTQANPAIYVGYNGGSSNSFNVGGFGNRSTVQLGGTASTTRGGNLNLAGGGYNTLTITNATLTTYNNSADTVGLGSSNNAAYVNGPGAYWYIPNAAGLAIGSGGATGNVLVINGGTVSNTVGTTVIGASAGSVGNSLKILNGGILYSGTLTNGLAAGASNNTVQVLSGGVLDMGASSMTVANGPGNVITNNGGVYQFTTASPTIVNNPGSGSIALNNGTISFRNVSSVNLTNNWSGTLTNIAFSGANGLRLNNSLGTNSLAGPYVFSASLGATNYARLELVNGSTALYGPAGMTVSNDASLLVSNTYAIVQGPLVNYSGTVTVTNALLELQGSVNNQGPTFTNVANGGISGGYQFNNVAQAIAGTPIALQYGVIGYRAVTNADVKANWAGWPGANGTTNITLLGASGNGFELNNATNTADPTRDQSYTFSTSLGSSNFAWLALVGNSRWRNGSVTIAADGQLLITNSTAVFEGAVTNLGTAKTYNSTVTYQGPYAIADGALNQVVNGTVNYNQGITLLGGAGFTNWIVNGTLGGSNYTVNANDLLGFAATNFWGVDTNSSAGFKVAAGGFLWISNAAYTVFTVPLTNAGNTLISPTAMLRVPSINNAGGTITNNGGYLVFTTNTPTIVNAAGIVVTNAGVGYYGITNADLKANCPGLAGANATTGLVYQGNNVFVLDTASNRNDASQSYTFGQGLGSTNWTGLVVANGGVYRTRGGDTVIFTNNATMQLINSTVGFTIGNGVSNVAYTLYGTNGGGTVWNNGGTNLYVGSGSATGNTLTVNGALMTNVVLVVGNGGANWNTMTVTNAQLWSSGLNIGVTANTNTVTVLPNSTWNLLGSGINIGTANPAYGNSLVINGGTVTNVGLITVGLAGGNIWNYGNNLTVSNGGALYAQFLNVDLYNTTHGGGQSVNFGGLGALSRVAISGDLTIGKTAAALFSGGYCDNNSITISNAYVTIGGYIKLGESQSYSNKLNVLQGGTLVLGGSPLQIAASGGAGSGNNNSMIINGGVVTGAVSTVSIGQDVSAPYQNWLTITNGGQLYNQAVMLGENGGYSNTFTVTGPGSLCNTMGQLLTLKGGTNLAQVLQGGLLDVSGFSITGAGHVITNSGSVYQFTAASPTMTGVTPNNCFINNGTLSFRGVTNADVKANWTGVFTNMAFSGVNAFRLNNATNNAGAAGAQTYWFDSGAGFGATNYAGLEMVNGGTAYTNGSVTIGTNGWLTCSNTAAIFYGAFTNYGRMNIFNSTVSFASGLALKDGGTVVWTSNSLISVNGNLTLPGSMIFSNAWAMGLSDVVMVLTNTGGTISGSPLNWTVYPNNHRLSVSADGKTLSLVPRQPGFLFYVQ